MIWDIFKETREVLKEMGGKKSGHWGHRGRKGKRGGSAPSKGGGVSALGDRTSSVDTRPLGAIREEVQDIYKKKGQFHVGEWNKEDIISYRGQKATPVKKGTEWVLEHQGVRYEIAGQAYAVERRSRQLRAQLGRTEYRIVNLRVIRDKRASELRLISKTVTATRNSDKVEGTIKVRLQKSFGIPPGEFEFIWI